MAYMGHCKEYGDEDVYEDYEEVVYVGMYVRRGGSPEGWISSIWDEEGVAGGRTP